MDPEQRPLIPDISGAGDPVQPLACVARLAPDIVEAIVDGREPSGLSLERLVKKMPTLWEQQRERFTSS